MFRVVNISLSATKKLNLTLKKGEFQSLFLNRLDEVTNFFQILARIRPTKGDIFIERTSIIKASEEVYKSKLNTLGVVFSDGKFIERKDIYENFKYYLKIRGISGEKAHEMILRTLKRFHLEEKKELLVGELSKKEVILVSLARAILTDPKFIIIDDIHMESDDDFNRKVLDFLDKLKRSGIGILYISSNREFLDNKLKSMKKIAKGAS